MRICRGNLLVRRHLNPESVNPPKLCRRLARAPGLARSPLRTGEAATSAAAALERMHARESTIDISIVFHSADNTSALCVAAQTCSLSAFYVGKIAPPSLPPSLSAPRLRAISLFFLVRSIMSWHNANIADIDT